MAQLAAFLKESASEVSDTDMGEVCRQMLILTQTATQIPVVIADAVEPLVMALRSREEPSLLGNLLAALAALVSRSQRPSCDMAAKAHELGALEDVERLLEVADKLAAEDGRRVRCLVGSATLRERLPCGVR